MTASITNEAKAMWAPFESTMSITDVRGALSHSLAFYEENAEWIIPSIALRGEGPALVSLLYGTKSMIVEVRDIPKGADFDFAGRYALLNIRMILGSQTVKTAEGKEVIYQTASARITHIPGLATTVTFAGSNLDPWLSLVKQAFPMSLLEYRKGPDGA